MFGTTSLTDRLTNTFSSHWWIHFLIGINLIVMSVLFMLLPELQAYVVAGFLMFTSSLLLLIAISYRSQQKKFHHWKDTYWIEV